MLCVKRHGTKVKVVPIGGEKDEFKKEKNFANGLPWALATDRTQKCSYCPGGEGSLMDMYEMQGGYT